MNDDPTRCNYCLQVVQATDTVVIRHDGMYHRECYEYFHRGDKTIGGLVDEAMATHTHDDDTRTSHATHDAH